MAGGARGGRLDDMNTETHVPADTDVPTDRPAFEADPVVAAPRLSTTATGFRLQRSRIDRMLGGVCGGLAESLGADAALLRVLVVALTLITGGAAALVYLAAWVLAPEGDRPAV
jgi:phage shock protein C